MGSEMCIRDRKRALYIRFPIFQGAEASACAFLNAGSDSTRILMPFFDTMEMPAMTEGLKPATGPMFFSHAFHFLWPLLRGLLSSAWDPPELPCRFPAFLRRSALPPCLFPGRSLAQPRRSRLPVPRSALAFPSRPLRFLRTVQAAGARQGKAPADGGCRASCIRARASPV